MKPREKLLAYGPERLESWELVATILGSGIQGVDVFTLSKKIAKIIEEKGGELIIDDLLQVKGIGNVKAMQLISAFELSKRYLLKESIIISGVNDVLSEVGEYRNKKQEYLLCLTLDGADRLISKRVVTIGLLNQSLVHPREVFVGAIEDRANSIILVHNHPSGTCYPSQADIQVTQRLQEVAKLVGIKLKDHVIITKSEYYSFVEKGDI